MLYFHNQFNPYISISFKFNINLENDKPIEKYHFY